MNNRTRFRAHGYGLKGFDDTVAQFHRYTFILHSIEELRRPSDSDSLL